MHSIFKIASLCMVLQLTACSQIDDYMLGKDNTPTPAPLKDIKSQTKVTPKWSVPVSSSKAQALSPMLVGSTIYTADATGLVQAINKENGKVLFTQKLDEKLISGPTVAFNRIALGTNTAKLVVLNESNGQVLWKHKLSSDTLAKPVIFDNKVIVKTIDGHLDAYALADGKQVWSMEHGAPALILKASSAPVVVHNVVLVGFSDGKLDAVDLKSGNLLWQRSIAYPNGSSDVERLVDIDADPIVRGDTVYLASYQGYVGALSLKTGEFTWHKRASTYKNMAMDNSVLYMTDSDDLIWAINIHTGKVKWKQEALKARGVTDPVLASGKLIVGDKTGVLHVLSTQTGELIGRQQLESPILIAPTIAGNQLYVTTANGKLNGLAIG